MDRLTTNSPLSRRIVLAFFDFLDTVQPAPGTDLEALEVAKDCLAQVFNIDRSCSVDHSESNLLINTFSLVEANEQARNVSEHTSHQPTSVYAPCSSNARNTANANHPESSNIWAEDWKREPSIMGTSTDELFGQFCSALEKAHFFRTMVNGNDDPVQLDRAAHLFREALHEMDKSGCLLYNQNSLADALKTLGNKAMQSKIYSDAIELYSCAISLCENNAVYYCNRAAAYTQIHKYSEAISDCVKSIEIDPQYSKAYSRLGLVYYAQGNYRDAIDKGFKKALELDPSNESVKENIQVAEQKLKEGQQRTEQQQSSSSRCDNQESNNQSTRGSRMFNIPQFSSMQFDINSIPDDFTSMLRNVVPDAYIGENRQNRQGEEHQNRQGEGGNSFGFDGAQMRFGGNILNMGEDMPEEITGAFRTVMEMFSGRAPTGSSQDSTRNDQPPEN